MLNGVVAWSVGWLVDWLGLDGLDGCLLLGGLLRPPGRLVFLILFWNLDFSWYFVSRHGGRGSRLMGWWSGKGRTGQDGGEERGNGGKEGKGREGKEEVEWVCSSTWRVCGGESFQLRLAQA